MRRERKHCHYLTRSLVVAVCGIATCKITQVCAHPPWARVSGTERVTPCSLDRESGATCTQRHAPQREVKCPYFLLTFGEPSRRPLNACKNPRPIWGATAAPTVDEPMEDPLVMWILTAIAACMILASLALVLVIRRRREVLTRHLLSVSDTSMVANHVRCVQQGFLLCFVILVTRVASDWICPHN